MQLFKKNKDKSKSINININKYNFILFKKDRSLKKEKKSGIKSLILNALTVLCTLAFIMSIFLFIPSNVSSGQTADNQKKYKYVFNLGSEEQSNGYYIHNPIGTNYTYTIYTTETFVDGKRSITIDDCKYNCVRVSVDQNEYTDLEDSYAYMSSIHDENDYIDTRYPNSLMDYMLNLAIGSYTFGSDDVSEKNSELFKKILFTCIDNGYEIWADDYNKTNRRYIINDLTNENPDNWVEDDDYANYYWYKWANREKANFKVRFDDYSVNNTCNPLLRTEIGTVAYFSEYPCLSNMTINLEEETYLYNYLSKNINILTLINSHIDNKNNVFGFEKDPLDGEEEENYSTSIPEDGTYSYKIREGSINKEEASEIVDIYYTNNSNTESVYSFLYYKGGEKGLIDDTNTKLTSISENNGQYILWDKNYIDNTSNTLKMYQCITNSTDKTGSSASNPLGYQLVRKNDIDNYLSDEYDKVCEDLKENDVDFDGDGINDGYLFYTNKAYKESFEEKVMLPYAKDYYLYGNAHAYAATTESDYVIVLDFARGYINKDIEKHAQYQEHYFLQLFADPLFYNNYQYMYEFIDYLGVRSYNNLKIPISELDAYFDETNEDQTVDIIDCGNWHLERHSDSYRLVAYNDPVDYDNGEEKCCIILEFKKGAYYKICTEYYDEAISYLDSSYKLHLKANSQYSEEPTSLSVACYKFYETGNYTNRYGAFLFSGTVSNDTSTADYNLTEEELQQNLIVSTFEGNKKIFLKFYDAKKTNKSQKGIADYDKIYIDDKNDFVLNSNGDVVAFDITAWIKDFYNEDELEYYKDVAQNRRNGLSIGLLTEAEAEKRANQFLEVLFKYAKPIFMFLLFIAIISAGIYSIANNQDAKKKVLVKEKLKHILYGVILFSCSVAILFFCKSLMTSSFEKIKQMSNALGSVPDIDNVTFSTNWFISLIAAVINSIGDIFNWAINSLLKPLVGGSGTDLNCVIFNQGVAISSYDLHPYTDTEWIRYMYGYRALSSLAIALLAVAVIKLAVDIILNSGNTEKAAEGKQTALRIVIAILVILLAPYGVRLLLLFFNYLVYMVPVRNINFTLDFGDTGILGACATVMFAWTKFQIYLAFLVRKIMITFMLLITPLVMGLWAISEKFRSLSLWIGELVTNCATQFAYALVFFIASLLCYENQSDFISLIMVMLFMKLADFFKDSMQGLVQKWGGIDETGVASNLAGSMVSWGRKTINAAKSATSKVGDGINLVDHFVDPEKVSNKGRHWRNAAMFLKGGPGAILDMETKGDTLKNKGRLLKQRKDQNATYIKQIKEEAKASGDENYKKYIRKIDEGKFSEVDRHNVSQMGENFKNKISNYEKAVNDQKSYMQAMVNNKKEFDNTKGLTDTIRRNSMEDLYKEYIAAGDKRVSEKRDINNDIMYNSYEKARKSLAEKSADLSYAKELNMNGVISNAALKDKCMETMSTIKNYEMRDDSNEVLTQTIKKEIEDALRCAHVSDNEIEKMLGSDYIREAASLVTNNKGEYVTGKNISNNKFIEEREKRLDDLKKAFGDADEIKP